MRRLAQTDVHGLSAMSPTYLLAYVRSLAERAPVSSRARPLTQSETDFLALVNQKLGASRQLNHAHLAEESGLPEKTVRHYLTRFRKAGHLNLGPSGFEKKPAIQSPENVQPWFEKFRPMARALAQGAAKKNPDLQPAVLISLAEQALRHGLEIQAATEEENFRYLRGFTRSELRASIKRLRRTVERESVREEMVADRLARGRHDSDLRQIKDMADYEDAQDLLHLLSNRELTEHHVMAYLLHHAAGLPLSKVKSVLGLSLDEEPLRQRSIKASKALADYRKSRRFPE